MSGYAGALGPFGPLLVPLVAALLGGIARSVVTRVKPDSQGIMLRFGKVLCEDTGEPKVYTPGMKVRVPGIYTLMQCRVLETNLEYEQQQFILDGGSVYIATPLLRYRITDVAKSLIDIDDVKSAVRQTSLDILRRKLIKCPRESLVAIDEQLSAVQEEINAEVEKWGVLILRIGLSGLAPEIETRQVLVVEQKTAARLKACKDAEAQGFTKELQVALSGDNPFLLKVESATASPATAIKELVHSNGHSESTPIPANGAGG